MKTIDASSNVQSKAIFKGLTKLDLILLDKFPSWRETLMTFKYKM